MITYFLPAAKFTWNVKFIITSLRSQVPTLPSNDSITSWTMKLSSTWIHSESDTNDCIIVLYFHYVHVEFIIFYNITQICLKIMNAPWIYKIWLIFMNPMLWKLSSQLLSHLIRGLDATLDMFEFSGRVNHLTWLQPILLLQSSIKDVEFQQ